MKRKIFTIKKLICIFSCIGFALFTIPSCSDFEEEPLDWTDDNDVWHSGDLSADFAKQYLNGIYNRLPSLHNRLDYHYLDSSTDDGVPTYDSKEGDYNVNAFRYNQISAARVVDNSWSQNYTGIRRANIFIKNMPEVEVMPTLEAEKAYWIAEAKFLRAFFYFELIKRWGGVPLIGDKIYDEKDEIRKERSSFEDCVEYILKELEEVEDALRPANKLENTDVGRITNGAPKALRSRLLLYAASPLNNPGNRVEMWQQAADAAEELLGQYSLHANFVEIFTQYNNKEVIMTKPTANNLLGVEVNNSPIGYGGYGTYNSKGYESPSQNLVDAFPTINGLSVDPSSSYYDANYNPTQPYANRDPRLTATIFYNGSRWLSRDVETFEGGLDKPNKTNQPQTKTGYYLRKFAGKFEESQAYSGGLQPYIIFRYAEILLNYAEALNEVSYDANYDKIKDAIVQLRKRAGINPGADAQYGIPAKADFNQEAMRELIHNERRIEMAYEEQRFWDLRRWKEAEIVLNQPVEGMKIVKNSNNTFTYSRFNVTDSHFDASRMYLYPIPLSEIYANPLLKQNPNWEE